MHSLANYVENHRKRLKNIEDVEGTTKCVELLRKLRARNHTSSTLTTIVEEAATTQQPPVEDDDMETAEEIMARQIAISTAVQAKAAAQKVLKNKTNIVNITP
jgi:hypothetical protein